MWFRYKYALNWSSPLSLWQMGWNGLVQLDWNAGSSGMSACLWNSPTWNGMPVAACFSLVYFSKQALWRAGFSLIPEIPLRELVQFSNKWTIKGKGSCCCNLLCSCTKEFFLINVELYFLFFLAGAVSQRWLTRCRASFILEIFVLSMQRAQQMDLLALWGKNSCSLVLETP